MLFNAIKNSLLVALLLLLITACQNNDPGENAAWLRIKLTDAASPVIKELYLDINGIEVFVNDSKNSKGEWIPVSFQGSEYNLFKLMNGRTVLLAEQYIPAGGVLQKIKLIPGSNSRMISNTSQSISLQLPPEIREGIIIDNVNAELYANIISSIVIDVNASLSVRELNGNYFIYPVARAFSETFGGKLRGFVEPVEAAAFIAVVHDTDTFMTLPEADGMFMFTGLAEGTWEVHMIANPLANYRDTVFTDTIVQGQITEIRPKPVRLKPV
ncbi:MULTISPECIES: DUF4382 domain-containing protein [Proteiniphilum]|jgi:hypothetical protein|nr:MULTISPECIES: DUF4382 domain-containing protein [Proteiniphilum]ULB33873.1 DUF4382 domain-containing protein [Proteiniphilum propionicum]